MSDPIVKSIRVSGSPEHVFRVFTDKLDLWWPPGHRRFERSCLVLEAREGGRFFERSDGGDEAELGTVLTCEPPSRLVYTWYPGADGRPTEISVVFSADADGTLIEVTHSIGESGLGDQWPERSRRFDRAWDHVLPAFAAFCGAPSALAEANENGTRV